jgi:AmmeMemoRadiSam system protein A
MNEPQRHVLLQVVRDAIAAAVVGARPGVATSDDPELQRHCGCFVTIKNHGRLRGCIGQFTSERPLIEQVVETAVASATSDPRFLTHPVTADELESLDLEISVLSPLQRTNDPLSLRLGTDGIYIRHGLASGCFLPQVATETGWTKEEFLSYCCTHKAGLPADAWKDPETQVFLFSAEVFGAVWKEI